MGKNRTISAVLFGAFGTLAAMAHPVTFLGGQAFEAFLQPDLADLRWSYSFHRRASLGVELLRDTTSPATRTYALARSAWLLHRVNGDSSQSNVYLLGGTGAVFEGTRQGAAASLGIETDVETRRWYASAKASRYVGSGTAPMDMYQARVGVAPYEGGADDLQTWLFLQTQYLPFSLREELRVGPVVRLFYRSVLGEIGTTVRGTWNFTFMLHW